jgi:carbamate kinase
MQTKRAGALLRLARETAAAGQTLRLVAASPQARRLLRWNGVAALLERGHAVPAPGA